MTYASTVAGGGLAARFVEVVEHATSASPGPENTIWLYSVTTGRNELTFADLTMIRTTPASGTWKAHHWLCMVSGPVHDGTGSLTAVAATQLDESTVATGIG